MLLIKHQLLRTFLFENQILPALPYTRPKTKEGFFRKHEYVYDEYYDCYICPKDQILSYVTTTKEGYRQYKSNPTICANCPLLANVRKVRIIRKMIQRHIWEDYVEEAEHLRHHTKSNKYMRNVKRRLNVSLPMQKKSMVCDGQP